MRPSNDTCKDYLLKVFNDCMRDKYNVMAVFDDRPCVVCMYQDTYSVFNVCRNYLKF
ncbi:Ac86-like protein [Bombyx mandarina nucleopolyhedrovirus]|uniref:ORF69A n=2 Tax=Bombyx mori nuclear polyhedrosis virus TaxID=271108 RepID=A0A8F4XBW1_NPVBM|nr:Ac86-like protein [Bombyx mandarina nucleopolyhedrovirus]QXI73262.1 ORF69A [Bombyx mori nucleopolyhedrovirus]